MDTTRKRPDCYQCIHRRDVPGDAHSSCAHPQAPTDNPMGQLMAILGKRSKAPPAPSLLNITFDPHGVRMGWACWPWNFDPVWLIECSGFTPRKEGEAT